MKLKINSVPFYPVCNIFLTAVSEGISKYPYIVALKKQWAHLGTQGYCEKEMQHGDDVNGYTIQR